MIQLERVYERGPHVPGTRFLVERLWPRGLKKADLPLDSWLREVSPSTQLRRWFSHDPAKWEEFRRRYTEELEAHPEAWEPILRAARQGPVTLLFSSRDTAHNNAVALKEYLDGKLRRPARRKPMGKPSASH
ncbi:MAG: DUF488 domain-containing protein [Archangium sp.]